MHQTIQKAVTASMVLSLLFGNSAAFAGGKSCTVRHPAPAAAQSSEPETLPDTAKHPPAMAKRAAGKTILFFMNPNGRPCRMQDEIIRGIKDSLDGLAAVTRYMTTESDHRDAFGKYGIRGLPSLIIVDDKGKELKRFTPGIQSGEAILAGLRKR